MPIELETSTAPRDPRGGTTANTGGSGVPVVRRDPVQIGGLNPLHSCDEVECRTWVTSRCPYLNRVFGYVPDAILSDEPTYKNGVNTFLVDIGLYSSNSSQTTCTIILQKCTAKNVWTTVATLSNNVYGIYYALNSIPNHATYTGYTINWGKVLDNEGAGIYRLRFDSLVRTIPGCRISEEFVLREFDCNLAHGLVRFDMQATGKIGDVVKQGRVHDLCGFILKDTIWLPGLFGIEKIKEYLEVVLEYPNGKMERERDEAIQSFTWISGYFPHELHRRMMVYFMMADRKAVSDYNRNNSNYNIQLLSIVKAGNYEPAYLDTQGVRLAKVTVEFNAGTQNLIKSLCCGEIKNPFTG